MNITASRIDQDTILLRCRAEGDSGLILDLAHEVHRGDADWGKAEALLVEVSVRVDGRERQISVAEARELLRAGKRVEALADDVWVPFSKMYPEEEFRDGSVGI